MNRTQLVDAVGERLGDRRTAALAVDAVLDTVTSALTEGQRVALFGFGVFERVERSARTARNPATGGTVEVPATLVPRFRPGQGLKDAVAGRTSDTPGRRAAPRAAGGAQVAAEGEERSGGTREASSEKGDSGEKGAGKNTEVARKAAGKKGAGKKGASTKADGKKGAGEKGAATKADGKKGGGRKVKASAKAAGTKAASTKADGRKGSRAKRATG